MNGRKKTMSMLLLLCSGNQIKCQDVNNLSTYDDQYVYYFKHTDKTEDLLKSLIVCCLKSDFADDKFSKLYKALDDDRIKRSLIGFLAATSNHDYNRANFLANILLSQMTEYEGKPICWILAEPKLIELKKEIISISCGIFQDWKQAKPLSMEFFMMLQRINNDFSGILSQLSIYVYLLRCSIEPTSLYWQALQAVGAGYKDAEPCQKAWAAIYDSVKDLII